MFCFFVDTYSLTSSLKFSYVHQDLIMNDQNSDMFPHKVTHIWQERCSVGCQINISKSIPIYTVTDPESFPCFSLFLNRIHRGCSVEIGKSQPEGPPVPVVDIAEMTSM